MHAITTPISQVTTPISHLDELLVTLSPLVGNTGEVGVSLLAIASDNLAIVVLVLAEEAFRIVVAVDIDLGQSVVCGWFLVAFMDTGLE